MLSNILYLAFLHISLLVPGYVLIRKAKLLHKHPGIELSFGYLITIAIFALLATLNYGFGFSFRASRVICWLILLSTVVIFIRQNYIKELWKLRFPLICLVVMSLLASAFMALTYNSKHIYIPDPNPTHGNNYNVLAVKDLNVAHTRADDNSIPYRQAQFFINRSDPATADFIDEWGVHFFQRTPLMGAVTANYFNLFNDRVPIGYIWAGDSSDTDNTYSKFQLLAQILNALFIIPAFFLIEKLFNRKTALITSLFLVISQFFLYNSFYSWPKSFVAFFALLMWLLLLQKRLRYTLLAGVAGGVAYLAHDLAVLYICTSIIFLLFSRRFRETIYFAVPPLVFMLPWVLTSSIVYHKASTFIYYPFSIDGIPQAANKTHIIHKFFDTSIWHILNIRLGNLLYQFSPYQLFTSEGGHSLAVRLWGLGLFSIPGALGLGLLPALVLGIIKKLQKTNFWILALTPGVLSVLLIGWPQGLGALHYAEAVVVLLSALAVYCLLKLKNKLWLYLAYAASVLQFIFFIAFSYDFKIGVWFSNLSDLSLLIFITSVLAILSWFLYRISQGREIWIAA